ncbi:hypothetical protein CLU79DRAFT_91153 [Phycomyces nitens]|nr:hypothetical protein CLU79DRAFT_91153 [Phycomyces nitens]
MKYGFPSVNIHGSSSNPATRKKSALPPATFTNIASVIQMNAKFEEASEREHGLKLNIDKLQKALAHKEAEVRSLKEAALAWKKKAEDYKNMYEESLEAIKEQDRILKKQHAAEMDILTKTHVENMDEAIATILRLESNSKNTESIGDLAYISDGTDRVASMHENNALLEENSIAEAEFMSYMVEETDPLVLSFNDMINAIEDEIERCKAEESSIYSDGYSESGFYESEDVSESIIENDSESVKSHVLETSSVPKESAIVTPVDIRIDISPKVEREHINIVAEIVTAKIDSAEKDVADRTAKVASTIAAAKTAIEHTEKVTANIGIKSREIPKQIKDSTSQKEEDSLQVKQVPAPIGGLPPLMPSFEVTTDDSDDSPEEVHHTPFIKSRYDLPIQKQTQRPLSQTRDQLSKVIPSIFRHGKKKDKEDVINQDRGSLKTKDSTDMSHTNFVLSMIQEQQRHASEDLSGPAASSFVDTPVFQPIPMDFRRVGQSATTNPQHFRSSEQSYKQDYPVNRFQSAQPLPNQSKTRTYPDISQSDLFNYGHGQPITKKSSSGLYQSSFTQSTHSDPLIQEPFKKMSSNDHLYSSSTLYPPNPSLSKDQWKVHKAFKNKPS